VCREYSERNLVFKTSFDPKSFEATSFGGGRVFWVLGNSRNEEASG
jgi:hypothetical protein